METNIAAVEEHGLISELSARVRAPGSATRAWIEDRFPGLVERVRRLMGADDDYRLDLAERSMPADILGMPHLAPPPGRIYERVWRALPHDAQVRPGDWIALSPDYARAHCRGDSAVVKSLPHVSMSDIYWAGTDENEFFYLPAAWRREAASVEEYLAQLPLSGLQLLVSGEEASVWRHRAAIDMVRERVLDGHEEEASGVYHGPSHWARVCDHAHAVARSLGIDPLVPHVFAWVHDSQREDDGADPEHGPRAAQFVLDHRSELFGFLADREVALLAHACREHTRGMIQGPEQVLACWDADRLDLWRVEVRPAARYMGTQYARSEDVIEAACQRVEREEWDSRAFGRDMRHTSWRG